MKKNFSKSEVENIIKTRQYDKLNDYDLVGADFRDMDLSYADLSGLNLVDAMFEGARLCKTTFENANLYNACFRRAEISTVCFYNASLRRADFTEAVITNSDFSKALMSNSSFDFTDVRYTDFILADMTSASLRNAKMYGCRFERATLCQADFFKADISKSSFCEACLIGANVMERVLTDEDTAFFALQCPEEGSFIGFKTAGGKIVKLRITEDSYRASATNRRCRCSKAEVLSISEIDGRYSDISSVVSDFDNSFVYEVGKTVEVKIMSKERWKTDIADGIQFYITRREAVNEVRNRRDTM